jgi:hypothetical protein
MATVSVDCIPAVNFFVPQSSGPKRPYVAAGRPCDGDAHCLNLGGVWRDLQRSSLGRDPAGELYITLA